MEYIYIGKIVNTHGLKGELRILSDFNFKDLVFKKRIKLYIGKAKEEMIISTYRPHKMYDMVTFDNYTNIDDVIIYKGENAYIKSDEIKIDGYFDEDLIGLDVYDKSKKIGKVTNILVGKNQDILVVENETSKNLIPKIDQFVKKIDVKNKKIEIESVKGLINEN